jgi:predicted MFS family arabinose efflux permease
MADGTAAVSPDGQAAAAAEQAIQRRLLLALGAAIFMINLDSRVVTPLLPTIAGDLDTTVTHAGWLVTAYVLPYGLFQLVYGPLSDRFGKVKVVAGAMIFFSLGTALCGLPPSLNAIIALRFLTGVAAAAVFPLTLAYVGDTVPYARRQATIAILATSSAAAAAFSTAAGGLIATLVSWRFVFPVFGIISGGVTVALLALRQDEIRLPLPEPRPRPRAQFAAALRAPLMLPLLVLVCLEGAIYNGAFTYLGGFLHERFALGALTIGFVLAGAGVAQLGAARLLSRLVRRFGERRLVLGGGLLMGAAYLIAVVIPSWPLFLLPILCAGAGFVICHSTLQTRATETFPASRGTAVALFAFSLFLGNGVGTAVVGVFVATLGYVPALLGSGLLLCGFAFAAARLLFGRPRAALAS